MLDIRKTNEIIMTKTPDGIEEEEYYIIIPKEIEEIMEIEENTILEISIKKVLKNG